MIAKLGGGVESARSGLDLAEFGEELPQFLGIGIERCRVRGVSFKKKKKLLYVAVVVVVVVHNHFSSSSLESSLSLSLSPSLLQPEPPWPTIVIMVLSP